MLLLNQTFEVSGKLMRLLWYEKDQAYWIDIEHASAWPEYVEYSFIESKLLDGQIRVIEDPHSELKSQLYDESSVNWKKCKHAWDIIKPHISSNELFYRNERGRLVRQLSEQYQITHQSIIRYLRRYWQRGMCMQALLPDYMNSGGKGKRRDITKSKLGRKRSVSSGIGVNTTPEIEHVFRLSIERNLLKKKHCSIPLAYAKALNLLEASITQKNNFELYPTITQFRYFLKREYSKTQLVELQTSDIEYEKDIRPLHSTSTAETLGPGFRYQIDATIADVYLLSQHDRSNIVGRPVVYFVVDVFSRMVVGMYVGFENPSWISAMMALINAATSKVTYCQEFGIEIDEQDWPCVGLPDKLLADQGELKGTLVESFITSSGTVIENAKARRGDAKGIVERLFRTIQCDFKPFTAGIVEPVISKKRGGKDYRLDATLTIHEFTKKIIELVLYHNNDHIISKYDRVEGMPGTVPSNPLSLWSWGISNLTGRLKTIEETYLRINLLPHQMATTSDFGVCLFGGYYTCSEIIKLGWLHRKASTRPARVRVAFDPRDANHIYIRPDSNMKHFWVCELTDRSRRLRNMTFWDVWKLRKAENKSNHNEAISSALSRGKVVHKMEQIEQEALKHKPNSKGLSKAYQLGNIRKNKLDERALERHKLKTSLTKELSGSAKIIPLPDSNNEDYSYPEFIDELFGDEDTE
ncbi:Mu transposase C-terminal domain-containing protein [Thalassotalea euphylliae]|uniref:Transposase n=1 Tax=Thalassotalea euphylliae TaxID=1655234 RepID=A0A3E0U521_9GAMM|nr:Mu transposase C-terminal domain-containing protein [Thalassotalea euphylliae]REL31285.1 transposase [Thalassotalea euphylliae]